MSRPPLHVYLRRLAIWHRELSLQLHGRGARDPHLRHGDRLLPLRQQGERPGARLHHGARVGRLDVAALHRADHHLPATPLRRHAPLRPRLLHLDARRYSGSRRLLLHPLRLSPLSQEGLPLRRPQASERRPQHSAQPLLPPPLPGDREELPGGDRLVLPPLRRRGVRNRLDILRQPADHRHPAALPDPRAHRPPLALLGPAPQPDALLQLAAARARSGRHPLPEHGADHDPLSFRW